MKNQFFKVAIVIVLGLFSTTPVFAVEPDAPMQNMDSMDMQHMKDMKQECMAKHKDGKMCDNKMMDQCHTKMSKSECKKMMDHSISSAPAETK